ncbi:phage antirepressor [Lacticaseibacillus zhaodongensis]|uniref:phage antirepressor n=1 Tax=Lacticaseibacillus zhaodongensis TaxID=2668065 RepID=UPI0012D2F790|nr:phage antirepressor KilAC domain-containing protein [Lacticaseibacillus zhaodongensis]
MNDLQVFSSSGWTVRTVDVNGEPYFVGKDIAEALGYSNTKDALQKHVDADDKLRSRITTSGQAREMTVISESGMYSLVLSSKLPSAKKFKHWVTSEVLPSVRKHGAYMTGETIMEVMQDPANFAKVLNALADERNQRQAAENQVAVMKPKAFFADAVSVSNTTILINDLAKLIRQNGYQIGGKRLFNWMRSNGYLVKRHGADYNSPTQKAMEMGLFSIKETVITHSDGRTTISKTPKVTGKGQQYFINKLLGSSDARAAEN